MRVCFDLPAPLPCLAARRRAAARGERVLCRASPSPAVPTTSAPVSDQSVPEAHQGLHSFLYGEGGAEVHGGAADDAGYAASRPGEDDGSAVVAVDAFLAGRGRERLTAVYAVLDAAAALQYVGYTRDVAAALRAHRARLGPDRVSLCRVMVAANRAMAGRGQLAEQAARWVAEASEAGATPPGNGPEAAEWEDASRRPAAAEESHEERALRLRKAMGESLGGAAAPGEAPDAATRRANTIKAVEGDDWSAVIEGQTAQTLPSEGAAASTAAGPAALEAAPAPAAGAGAAPPISTPFARASVHRAIGEPGAPAGELSVESAERALDEVRPYLVADGGNVEVVSVEDGVVRLRLQGACGTCPSSAGTMKMGIERALKGAFGDALAGVEQVDALSTAATPASVDAHLDALRPALASYSATVQVLAVERGVCRVAYTGPEPLAKGISAAIRDHFPDIRAVECSAP